MNNIINEGILITLRYQATSPEPLSERTPAVKNVQLSGINISGAERPIAIYGLAERDVSDISFSDIRISSEKGILLENASGIRFHDITMDIRNGSPLSARDSRNITWDMVTITAPVSDFPYLKLLNCQNIKVSNCYQISDLGLYVSGDEKCSDIYIFNNVFGGSVNLSDLKGKNIVKQNNIIRNESKPLTN